MTDNKDDKSNGRLVFRHIEDADDDGALNEAPQDNAGAARDDLCEDLSTGDRADKDARDEYDEEEVLLGGDDEISTVDTQSDEVLAAPKRIDAIMDEFEERGAPTTGAASWFTGVAKLAGVGFSLAAVSFIGFAIVAGLYLNRLNQNLPDYQALANYAPAVTTRVYAADGSLVAEFARERRLFVPIEQMPAHVTQAFVSAEDKSFFEHDGLDPRGIVRAQLSNIQNILQGRRLEGGSTITQQVAKNFLLTSEQKIERKLREMLISRKMEKTFTKNHILELYLNEIYLGNRSYGVAAAALNYFDKPLSDLTIAEASYLAAITKGPSNYHPVLNEDRAVERRNWVVGRLLADGHITQEQADEARAQPLGAQIAPPLGARDWTMEYFAEEVRKQIVELYGVKALYDGGLSVRTSVDPEMQKKAGDALRRWLVAYDQRHGWRGALGQMSVPANPDEIIESDRADEQPRPAWAVAFAQALDPLRDARVVSDDMAPWKPALVLDVTDNSAKIGFEDASMGTMPLSHAKWAREHISANDLGAEITALGQVVSVGDIVYVDAARKLPQGDDEPDVNADIIDGAYALRQAPAINGGLIAIDPHTGRVRAMVGGFSFQKSEFNRAVQAERQPGSTFKPFVYSAALDSGYTPASIVLDAPFVAPGIDSWYKPGNYIEGRYYGNSTLRLGIEQSRNAMTARLAQDLGIGRIMGYIERFQLSDRLPRELAISLGAGETTLMKITAAYSTFVNGGKRVDPVLIDRIQDRTGKTIYKRDTRRCAACNAPYWAEQAEPQLVDSREEVLDPRTAYQITSILEGVVVRGTGSAVRKVTNKPLAGKTGTTNDYKDAWFVGFSPDLAAGVYVGFDMPQTLGRGEAGGKVAAPIFADFMKNALENEPSVPFRVPSGIRLVRVNAKTGRPASTGNVILEAFKADDIMDSGPTSEELFLDPLSSAPGQPDVEGEQEEDLNGLY